MGGWLLVLTGLSAYLVRTGIAQLLPEPEYHPGYGTPRQIARLANEDILESSGLVTSRRQPGMFWTHNDSGDKARIFAFDRKGTHCGECRFGGVVAEDCEDLATFERDGKPWLLLADVGDNRRQRETYQLYVCEEPAPGKSTVVSQQITFRYGSRSFDCESVAVDQQSGIVLLVTKVFGPNCSVYQLPLLKTPGTEVLIAEKVADLPVPLAVAMDVSPDGSRAVVLTYGDAFEFSRSTTETWHQAFLKKPLRIKTPIRRQGEAICYGEDGRTLYLTSESPQSPLWEIPWNPAAGASETKTSQTGSEKPGE